MNNYNLILSIFLLSASFIINAQEKIETHIIPFELTSHNNISIKGLLNGADTLNLMFHTAANSVSITTEAISALTNMKWDTEEEVSSWGGNSSARYSKHNFLEIANMKWDSIEIWETMNSGPNTDGKCGPNLFSGKVVEIDFDQSIITVHETIPSNSENYVKTPLIFENGFMFIEGISTVNGESYPNRFLIHSGYGSTILFDDKFAAENKLGELIEIVDEKELKDSYGNVLKTKKGILPKFSLGGETFINIPVGFFEGAIGRQQMSVIGGDLIKRFNMIIDAERENIYLKPNHFSYVAYTEF